jgi:hypothetical protein
MLVVGLLWDKTIRAGLRGLPFRTANAVLSFFPTQKYLKIFKISLDDIS